jgi:hypothetical protein
MKPGDFKRMAQLDSQRVQPHLAIHVVEVARRVVAVQVDPFESKELKPCFHFIVSRDEIRRFQGMGAVKLNASCAAPPPRR